MMLSVYCTVSVGLCANINLIIVRMERSQHRHDRGGPRAGNAAMLKLNIAAVLEGGGAEWSQRQRLKGEPCSRGVVHCVGSPGIYGNKYLLYGNSLPHVVYLKVILLYSRCAVSQHNVRYVTGSHLQNDNVGHH